ncbi:MULTISPECIES: acyltransferase [unclassified Acinetobacter]|uniref:LpxL/LpxP family acyltransferase n=1 Tax=unclassified Acinetobacter TaxID=196816 RepID=UPI00293463D0|nr:MULTISPECIES: acyltransferase [unclassified Acinetobacter]WOE31252.1 acyltransferase [Acinetobacter sp. SAAs470]WOE39448.1 acyltransferase [Acinetobacter sp. SAAs474]
MVEKNTQKWNTLQERGGMLPLKLMLIFYRLGGRSLCRLILYFIIMWYWLFSRIAREASLEYLQRLHQFFGQHSPFSSSPTWLHSYRHLMTFAESILDKIEGWLGHIGDESLELYGHEHFREHYQRGTILVVSHFGNIELLRAIKSEHQQKINVLVYQKHAGKFNRFLKELNQNVDINLISVDELGVETALVLQQKLDQGEWVIVAADRTPVQSDKIQLLDFLGQQAAWPQGAWLLAHLLKVPVLAVFCYRVGDKIQVHIHHIAQQLNFPRHQRIQAMQQVTQKYIELLQHHCRLMPYQWFNFYHFWNK